MTQHHRQGWPIAAFTLLGLFGLLLMPSVAGAQTPGDDGYGGTSTTEPPAVESLVCALDLDTAAAGTVVTATLTGQFSTSGEVRVTFNGSTVARQRVTGDGSTVQATLRFSVPNLPAGTYDVTAIGPGFTEPCGRGTFTITAGAAGTGVNPGDGGGGGNLARTGADLAPWVLVGVALLGVGTFLVRRSRGRPSLG